MSFEKAGGSNGRPANALFFRSGFLPFLKIFQRVPLLFPVPVLLNAGDIQNRTFFFNLLPSPSSDLFPILGDCLYMTDVVFGSPCFKFVGGQYIVGAEMMMNGALGSQALNSSSSSSTSAGPDSGGPMTSTPIGDRSFVETGMEQPTSSTEDHIGIGNHIGSSNNGCYGMPKYGTLIPNRVFVGGISSQTTECELLQLFSSFGTVRGTKIIMDRGGISKGYGFVTFESEEEARRLVNAMNSRELPPIVHRDRRLNIAPAVKKQNTTYGSSQSSGGTSSTFSPPPFESYIYATGGSPQGGGLFLPQMQLQETFFPQTNAYAAAATGSHHHLNPSSAGHHAQAQAQAQAQAHAHAQLYGSSVFPYGSGLGQAIPGPNGSILFLPMGMPYQQQQAVTAEQWSNAYIGSAGAYNPAAGAGSLWPVSFPG